MSERNYMTIIYGSLLAVGFLCAFIPPIIPLAAKQKLVANEFTLQVALPSIIGLILTIIGFYGIMQNYYNELNWQILIAISAGGAIAFSTVAAFHSVILVRWRSD